MLKRPDILQQAKKSYEERLPVFIDQIAMISNTELDDAFFTIWGYSKGVIRIQPET